MKGDLMPARSGVLVAAVIAAVSLWAGAGFAAAAPTDTGVGISAASVTLTQPAPAGSSHTLGPVTVVNTGSDHAVVALRAAAHPDGEGQAPPEGWVTFDPAEVPLDGGAGATVDVNLSIPDDAPAGDYRSLVVANITAPGADGASGIGAEAATELTFTVTDVAQPDEQASGDDSSDDRAPTLAIGAVAVLVGAAIVTWWRRHRSRDQPN